MEILGGLLRIYRSLWHRNLMKNVLGPESLRVNVLPEFWKLFCFLTRLNLKVCKMKSETVQKFKQLYSEKKDVVEWMLSFGNDFEKVQAKIIRDVALGL